MSQKNIWLAREHQKAEQACTLSRGGYGIFCLLCGKETDNPDDYDFHHWDYEQNIGIFVCRNCHDAIHKTQDSYPDSGSDWRARAATNAFDRLVKENPKQNTIDSDVSIEEVCDILNLPKDVRTQFR